MLKMKQKGFANVILIAVIVILLGVVGYVALVKQAQPTAQNPAPTAQSTKDGSVNSPQGNILSVPKDWKTYRNDTYGFEVKYPANWKEEEPSFSYQGINLTETIQDPFNLFLSFTYWESVDKVAWSAGSNQPKSFEEYAKDPMFENVKAIDFFGNKAYTALFRNPNIAKDFSATYIIISHNGHIYEISYNNAGNVDINKKVISTFKFTK